MVVHICYIPACGGGGADRIDLAADVGGGIADGGGGADRWTRVGLDMNIG